MADRLTRWAGAFLAANLLHGADHLRQGLEGVSHVVLSGGAVVTATAVVVVVLAVRRHPAAALAATLLGFATTVLVSASHLAPHWSVLSDSYVDDVRVDAVSWVVVLLEIGTALVLGVVAAQQYRSEQQVLTHG